MINQTHTLGQLPRAVMRKLIASHPEWKAYSREFKINSGKLDSPTIHAFCNKFDIDMSKVEGVGIAPTSTPFANVANGGGEPIDWSRVRSIAKDECIRRLDPVYVERIIVERNGEKIPVDTGDLVHPEFSTVLDLLMCRDFNGAFLNVMVTGEAGTGKTYSVERMAKALGIGFAFQSIASEVFDLAGYVALSGEYQHTAFTLAFSQPVLLLLDEADRWNPAALIALNAALSQGKMTLANGAEIKRHPDFRCVMATNTFGLGAVDGYTTAQAMDLSTLDRFSARVLWTAHEPTQLAIAEAKGGANGRLWAIETFAAKEALAALDLPALSGQRCIESGCAMLTQGLDPETVRRLTYLAVLDTDQRAAVMSRISESKKVTLGRKVIT